MKVKIERAFKDTYWYADRIGHYFYVRDKDGLDYEVIGKTGYYIRKEDCKNIFISMMEKAIDKSKYYKKLFRETSE